MATPMTVKMPEPMTAPMPRAVSETGPSDLRRARSGRSDSAISLSMDLVAKICLGSVELLQYEVRPCNEDVNANAFAEDASAWSCRVRPS